MAVTIADFHFTLKPESENDPPRQLSPEDAARMKALDEERVRYHRVLGEYVAEAIQVEAHMDMAMRSYFAVYNGVRHDFDNWVLGRLQFNSKVEIIQEICRTLLIDDEPDWRNMITELKKVQGTRNDLAHGRYGQRLGPEGKMVPGLRRRGRHVPHHSNERDKSLDLDAIEAHRESLHRGVKGSLVSLTMKCDELHPHYVQQPDGSKVRSPGTLKELEQRAKEPRPPKVKNKTGNRRKTRKSDE